MEPLIIPADQLDGNQAIRNKVVTRERTLVPSIRLQWTKNLNFVDSMLNLNDEKVVRELNSKEQKMACLRIHGIPIPTGKTILLKQFVVCVFQTQVLLIYRTQNRQIWLSGQQKPKQERFERILLDDKSREIKKVKIMATRALYAVGLDYGVVRIGLQAGNELTVLDVVPTYKLNLEMENLFVGAIRQYVQRLPATIAPFDQVMLGADPEFILRHKNGNLVMASEYFPRFGRVGCDAIWHGEDRSDKPLVELRPQPTTNPRQLVIRLYKIMVTASKKVNNAEIEWLSGALPHPKFPLGGHIHFSGISLNFKLLRALDHYLALPLMLAEDPRGIGRRPKYGYLGDFRTQFHGGFEYRTLPSWLISPTLTKGVVAAAKVIAARYPYLPADDLKDFSVQRAYYRGEKKVLKERVMRLWGDLISLQEYQLYKSSLDPFYEYVFSSKSWQELQDFRVVWKLPPYHS